MILYHVRLNENMQQILYLSVKHILKVQFEMAFCRNSLDDFTSADCHQGKILKPIDSGEKGSFLSENFQAVYIVLFPPMMK